MVRALWRAVQAAVLIGAVALSADLAARAETPASPHASMVKQQPPQRRRAGEEFDDCNGERWCPRMIVVPAGSFTMGSPDSEEGRVANEGPQRRVNVRQFAVGKFEITWDQWLACVDRGGCRAQATDAPSFGTGQRPVINVSWNNAREYVQWLSIQTRQSYRLLTEAEWEYAARAGTTTRYPWADEPSHEHANYGTDSCCDGLALGRDEWLGSAPVGSFPANAFGLHDMHGNVWEWVQDCFVESYTGLPATSAAHDSGATCETRVYRGGSWSSYPRGLRSAVRNWTVPSDRVDSVGFRVARVLN